MVDEYADAPAVGLEVLPALRTADHRVTDGWLVPRRRRDRFPVPRARPRVGHARRRRAQGPRGTDPVGVGRGGVAPRRRAGGGGVPRRDASSCTTRATSAIRTARRVAFDPDAPDGCRPAGGEPGRRGHRTRRQRVRRAREHLVPHAAPARWKPRTCSASSCARSGPIASCGAPTPSGTGRRSPSSTRSAPSRSPSGCRRRSATRAHGRDQGEDPRRERARRSTASRDDDVARAAADRDPRLGRRTAPTIAAAITRAGRP